jgi:hypothetical protein
MIMASKKKSASTTGTANPQALKIGGRVRCTDGVEGRIVWANAVAVKVKWDDGEQVTWKRDSLADRPVEILDPDAEQDQPEAPAAPAAGETAATEVPRAEVAPAAPEAPATEPAPAAPATEQTVTPEPGAAGPAPAAPEPAAEPVAPVTTTEGTEAPAKPKRQRKAAAEPKEKKVSALDAAARVLAEEGKPMSCKELIGAMAAKGYWTSPGGKTPDATLCSAILRELATKGDKARFRKVGPGQFASRAGA